jgi:NitT/TauT family transport system permease protein
LAWSLRATAAALLPPAAALAALLAHRYLPNRQTAIPTRLYPMLLQIILAATVALAALHWVWRPLRRWTWQNGPLLAGAILWFMVWDLITLKLALMPLPYFPGPDMVLQGIMDDRNLLFSSTFCSLKLLLSGYLVGVCAGVFSGVMMGWFLNVRYWGMPVMKLLGPIPATALVSLAMLLFRSPFMSGTALIAWAVWFPVTMLTTSGVANVPVFYLDAARTLGAGRLFLIFRVAIPSAMPSIFIGLFMGLLVSFLALMVAETVGVKDGLGFYLKWQQGYAEFAKVWAAILIMAAFFSSILSLLFKMRDWVLVWQKGVIRW